LAPRYLLRDRDRAYGAAFTPRLRAMGIRDKPIARGSPWQNGFAERLIGSIRRECVDHVIVLGEAHLRRILTKYAVYYNELRTHRSLGKDAPIHRAHPTRGQHRIGSGPRWTSSPLSSNLIFGTDTYEGIEYVIRAGLGRNEWTVVIYFPDASVAVARSSVVRLQGAREEAVAVARRRIDGRLKRQQRKARGPHRGHLPILLNNPRFLPQRSAGLTSRRRSRAG
jgi:Integrase core domain